MRGLPVVALLVIHIACTPVPRPAREAEALKRGLLTRAATDQALRDTLMASMREQDGAIDTALAQRLMALDRVNARWLAENLPDSGWFRVSDVGTEGVAAAFLLVQHAADTNLQARVLPLLRDGVSRGEVSGQDYALLTDRVATQRGLAQVFGTQAEVRDGRVVFLPIADSAGVDARRAAIGLVSIDEYARLLDSLYVGRNRH